MKATSRLGAQLAPFGRGLGVGCLLGVLGALAGCPGPRAEPPRVVPDAGLARASAEAGPPVDGGKSERHKVAWSEDDQRIAVFAGAYLKLLQRISPETATTLGLHARDSDLDARDKALFQRDTELERAFLAKLDESFPASAGPPAAASAASRTDLALLRGMLRADLLRRAQRPLENEPQLYTSPVGAVFAMTARDQAPGPERAAAVLARLEKIPAVLAEARKNLERPPRVWTEVAIERARGARGLFTAQRAPLEKHLPGELPRVKAAVDGAIKAYADYVTFLQQTLLPRSTGTYAAGTATFSTLLREGYFVTETPDELAAMGRRVLADTTTRMTEVARRIDPKAKSWPEVVAKAKGNHPKKDGLLVAYRFEVQRARDFLLKNDVVPFPEGDDLSVIDTPELLRSTVTTAYDPPPPFDDVTKGALFVTPLDPKLSATRQEELLRGHNHGAIVGDAVREVYPGHHLQRAFAAKNPSTTRKAYAAALDSEGWALYAEELMAELGYCTDEERLMQLAWTLLRAARVVIDVGLHTKGMTLDEAVRFLTDNVHLEHELALREVTRTTMAPTQSLAPLMGREALFAIRERYKAREKGAYSLKRFHTELLERGTLPPGLLAKELFGE